MSLNAVGFTEIMGANKSPLCKKTCENLREYLSTTTLLGTGKARLAHALVLQSLISLMGVGFFLVLSARFSQPGDLKVTSLET